MRIRVATDIKGPMNMKCIMLRTGVAVAALLATPLAATAADMMSRPPVFSAPVYANWTGFYLGVNGGYGFGTSVWNTPAVSTSPTGAVAGLTAGYNLQTGQWLWGIEGDADWSGIKGSVTCGVDTCETKNSWLATLRGRVGYAGWSGWLPYITAGGAGGDIKATESFFGSATKTQIGWTAGAGLEYSVWSSVSIKAEYLYVDLGSFDCGISCGATPDTINFHTHLVRAGVNYRF